LEARIGWDINNEIVLKVTRYAGVCGTDQARDRDQCRAVVNRLINLRVL